MKLFDTVQIAQHFAAPLWNDDTTGLSDDDYELLTAYFIDLPYDLTFEATGDTINTEFARCAITGLMADTIEINIYAEHEYE